jgi:superfamily II DNA or RNA helicase
LRLWAAGGNAGQGPVTLLHPFDRPARVDRVRPIAVVRSKRWVHALRRTTALAHPFGGLSAAAAGTIDLLPYQLEPALAMLRGGSTRIMIADAVGLGKTIQASIVLAELSAMDDGFRGLVIAPAGLRHQWLDELGSRFGLTATIADSAWLRRLSGELPADVNPWILPGLYVASPDFIKRTEVLHPIASLHWDLVVIDEAHGASIGTARRAALDQVALRASRVILLTATPHAGDASEFQALCRLGQRKDDCAPILMFRRSRADAGVEATRRTVLLPVVLTSEERRMHRLLDAYASLVCREAGARADSAARLAIVVLKKRALSSAASLAASVRRRLSLLRADVTARLEYQQGLGFDDSPDEECGDAPPDALLGAPGLDSAAREQQWLSAIAECATNAGRAESKLRFLLRLLRRIRQSAIVFTEFRDTLNWLRPALAATALDVRVLHGGLDPVERQSAQQGFNLAGGILLATDAASEGLNLHQACKIVVHYELPWSPARLEQRTGRVDRLGQQNRVHEILLIASDTAEQLVLAPLVRRVARAHLATPFLPRLADALSESRVANAVLAHVNDQEPDVPEPHPPPIAPIVLPSQWRPTLSEEARVETTRIRDRRASLALQRTDRLSSALTTTMVSSSKAGLPPGIVCVYTLTLATRAGHIVRRLVACALEHWTTTVAARTSADVRSLAATFLKEREPAVRAVILSAAAEDLTAAAKEYMEALDSLERRQMSTVAPARRLVQQGLFDSRALKEIEDRDRVADAWLEVAAVRAVASARAKVVVTTTQVSALLIIAGTAR